MTFIKKLKAIINQFAWEQDWNIQEYAVHKRDINYRRGKADAYGDVVHRLNEVLEEFPEEPVGNPDKMTLEEAKKEIAGRKAMYDSIVDRISDPYNPARDFYKGEASGLSEAVDILAEVDTESVGKDKLTLTELAKKLRKLFEFKYLTVTDDWPMPTVMMWSKKPEYDRGWCIVFSSSYLGSFNCWAVRNIDLSEYKDADGNIDYSKCIVEVE